MYFSIILHFLFSCFQAYSLSVLSLCSLNIRLITDTELANQVIEPLRLIRQFTGIINASLHCGRVRLNHLVYFLNLIAHIRNHAGLLSAGGNNAP